MKKIVLSILMTFMGFLTVMGAKESIIITPKLNIVDNSTFKKSVEVYPNSQDYPNHYEVKLNTSVMVNTFQSGKFSISCYQRVKGTSTWSSFYLNSFPNTGPGASSSSTYSGSILAQYQLEGTEYEYRVRVVFTCSEGTKSAYSDIVSVKVLGVSTPCFKMLNVKSTHNENSYYGPIPVNVICQNAVTIDGSCSKFEQGYFIRIAEFNLSTWQFGSDLYSEWVDGTNVAPQFISLNALVASKGKYFQSGKLYIVGFSIGPVWKSATPQFFRIDTGCKISTNEMETAEIDIEENIKENKLLTIYPNPTQSEITISIDSKEKLESFLLFDIYGTLIKKGTFYDGSLEKINVNNLRKGTYLLEIQSDKNNYKEKIIKE